MVWSGVASSGKGVCRNEPKRTEELLNIQYDQLVREVWGNDQHPERPTFTPIDGKPSVASSNTAVQKLGPHFSEPYEF
jgi:hypothetical protein